MAFDEGAAQRVREILQEQPDLKEKKMFGGLAFMLSGHMCVGVVDNLLMARVGPAQYESCLTRPYVRKMDFTGRPMKGFLFIEPAGFEADTDLMDWIERCQAFVRTLPLKV
jgi:hypothetical protein